MNKHILNLADQAYDEYETDAVKYECNIPDAFCLKFAQLIIKECVRIDVENPDAAPGVEIVKHFGIIE